MAMNWSRLHEVLGVESRALTYSDIQKIEENQIPEEAGLDWKGKRSIDEGAKTELAKDLAAMANSGGGVIVFGMAEHSDNKRPIVEDIPLIEQADQQIRSIALSRVTPPISGIDVEMIHNPENAGSGVIVVTIPNSPNAPHFFERNQVATAPRRDGAGTTFLKALDIERAIREKIHTESVIEQAVSDLAYRTGVKLDFNSKSGEINAPAIRWLVVAAKPLMAPPLGVGSSSAAQAKHAWATAQDIEQQKVPNLEYYQFLLYSWMGSVLPKKGFNRWILRNRYHENNSGKINTPFAELLEEGGIVFACPVGELFTEEGKEPKDIVRANLVELGVISAVSILEAWTTERKISGQVLIEALIASPPGSSNPTWLHGNKPYGALSSPGIFSNELASPVIEFEKVHAVLDLTPASDLASSAKTAIIDLAGGILSQFERNVFEVIV